MIAQQTEGGFFSIWDNFDNLLLSAELGEGFINGTDSIGTGNFFNTEIVNYTGGSLLNLVSLTQGGISLALASILSGGQPGLDVVGGVLQDFSANADGLVAGQTAVPEPASMALLLSGLIGGAIGRKKIAGTA